MLCLARAQLVEPSLQPKEAILGRGYGSEAEKYLNRSNEIGMTDVSAGQGCGC